MASRGLILTGAGPSPRVEALAAALSAAGVQATVTAVGPGRRVVPLVARERPEIVVTAGSAAAHIAGFLLRRRGACWVMDIDEDSLAATRQRLGRRLPRWADVVTCATGPVVQAAHTSVGAATLLFPSVPGREAQAALARQVEAQLARRRPATGLRVVLIGPVNSPHIEHLALALHHRDVEVIVGGEIWPGLPPTVLPGAGIAVEPARTPFALWVRSLIRRTTPHVVHAHWTPLAFKVLLATSRPVVVSPWGSDVYRASGRFRLANRLVARRADRIVSDSADLLEAMVALGARRDRSLMVNWGVDLDVFRPPSETRAEVRRRLGLGEGPMVLSPRSLTPIYNPRAILDAFRKVRERVPAAQLVLKHMAEQPPEDLGPLPEGVRVVGHVAYDEMPEWYRAADVCISIPSSDSSPRSVWEAMACACPCVVSDLPWVHEVLTPGSDALVVPVDAGAAAEAVLRLLGDEALARRIGAAGRDVVERERDQQRELDRLVAMYRELAGVREKVA